MNSNSHRPGAGMLTHLRRPAIAAAVMMLMIGGPSALASPVPEVVCDDP